MEASHTNQIQRRGTQGKGAGPTREKAGQPPGPTQAKAHNASQSPQRQPEAGDPARRPQKSNPPTGGKATSRSWTELEHIPYLRQVTQRKDQEHHSTKESRGTVAPRREADKNLTKNQGNNLHCQVTEVGQPRSNLNHLKPTANMEARGKNPSKDSKKIPGAWTIKRQEPPSKNPGQGKEFSLKRRQEPRQDHSLPTQVLTNSQRRKPRR